MSPSPAPPNVSAGTTQSAVATVWAVPNPATSPGVTSFRALLVVAIAYFALGVATGALVRRLERVRTPMLVALVVPGVMAGLGYLAWIAYSLR